MPKGPNWRVIAAIKKFGDNEKTIITKEKKIILTWQVFRETDSQ